MSRLSTFALASLSLAVIVDVHSIADDTPSSTPRSKQGILADSTNFNDVTSFPEINRYLENDDISCDVTIEVSKRNWYRLPEDVANRIAGASSGGTEQMLAFLVAHMGDSGFKKPDRIRTLMLIVLSGTKATESYSKVVGGRLETMKEFGISWIQERAIRKGFPPGNSKEEWVAYYKSLDRVFDNR